MQKKTLEFLVGFTLFILLLGIISVYALGYFDSDGDGVIDKNDAFPYDPTISKDSDKDGIADKADAFPYDPAASRDSDNDGHPNEWNSEWNASTDPTILTLDVFPYNPTEWQDSDQDGIGDNTDAFPYDPAASKDSDNDGYPDEWNIEWNSNSTKACPISGLLYNTTYRWNVQVNDGYHWTNQSYTFTTQTIKDDFTNQSPLIYDSEPMNESSEVPINTTILSVIIQNPDGESFNWTITTLQDIGNSSGTRSTNGTKTCTISNLMYNTTYIWTVLVDDGHHRAGRTYLFTIQSTESALVLNPLRISSPNPMDRLIGVPINTTSLSISIQRFTIGNYNWTITTSPNIGSYSESDWITNLTLDPSPYNSSNVLDSDGDGTVNSLDMFLNDPAASLDTDHDGFPDEWNIGWNSSKGNTTLILDTFPNDPNRWRNVSALPTGIVSDKFFHLTELSNGKDLTYDGASYYYILDHDVGNNTWFVYQYYTNFSFSGLVWNCTNYVENPVGITFYNDYIYILGNKYINKGYRACVFIFSLQGNYESTWTIIPYINNAQAITSSSGLIYFCNRSSIYIFNESTHAPEGSFNINKYPSDIAVYESGNWCYINDQLNINRLFLYTLDGKYQSWTISFIKQSIELVGDRLIALSENKISTYKLL